MYICINCGVKVAELYRRYSPSVLKVLKCNKCGCLADKYIEYDPVIVLVDLVLLEKSAYRHLLYNSAFKSYWKLMVVLLLSESFRVWSSVEGHNITDGLRQNNSSDKNDSFDRERSFYTLLCYTTLSLSSFVFTVIIATELRWLILNTRPLKYKTTDLIRALIVGGCAKLLTLLGLVWEHVAQDFHYILIYGYTMLCLLTAYSVVCESGRGGSLIGLTSGLIAHNYVSNCIYWFSTTTMNITVLRSETWSL
ncbi:hypothetical protein PV328_003273 [Microctonus aethiopoides]|uniref:Protein ARV n=1 Tax=Microctonus aethiopoides TaxID=144406 RepID=A0AA39KKB5_9HYME|nr:hypothetical protein PV328_003273 [Microctonus aethiopoides]